MLKHVHPSRHTGCPLSPSREALPSKSSRGQQVSITVKPFLAKTYLIKWSGVVEAAIPDLVHGTLRSSRIRALGVRQHGLYCPPPNTCLYTIVGLTVNSDRAVNGTDLVLLGKSEFPAIKEFARPTTITTQAVRAYLHAKLSGWPS
jgi:hypothetical protein